MSLEAISMRFDRWLAVPVVMCLWLALPLGVAARDLDFTTIVPKDPFKDLPGVKAPQQDPNSDAAACTSRIERAFPRDWHSRDGLGHRVYRCDMGNITIESDKRPDEIDWRKQKNYYKPWIRDGY